MVFVGWVIKGLSALGYDTCRVEAVPEDREFSTPRGRLKTRVTWEKDGRGLEGKITVEWGIES